MPPVTRESTASAEIPVAPALQVAPDAETLSRLTALLQAALPLEEVLHQILSGATEVLDVERAEIYIFDERDRVLVGSQVISHRAEGGRRLALRAPAVKIPVTDCLEVMSAAVLRAQTHVIDDVSDPTGGITLHRSVRETMGEGAFAAVPLQACGQVVGVLTLNDARERLAARRRMPLLAAFAAQAGLAIERARLFEDRERAIADLTRLMRATTNFHASLPPPDLLRRVLEGVAEGLDVGRAALFLPLAGGTAMAGREGILRQPETGVILDPSAFLARIRQLELPVQGEAEIVSAATLRRHPCVAAEEGSSAAGGPQAGEALRAVMGKGTLVAVPLVAGEKVVGVIAAAGLPPGEVPRRRLDLLEAYGAQAGLAIERTLLDERLRESERRHREFLELSPDGIVTSTPQGRILSCNDAFLRLVGYSREELLALDARDLYADPARREEVWDLNTRRGQIEGVEVTVKRKDGSIVRVSASTRLRREPGGDVLESIVRDVTGHYEAQRKLRAVADLVAYSADAIVSVDAEARVASWNLGAERIFGYTPAEIIGRPYQTLVPEDLQDELCRTIRPRVEREGRLLGFESVRLHKDGRRIPVSLTVTRLRQSDGPDLGWSVILRDITQRRQVETHLRLLSSIIEQSPDAILSVDREGRITSWNRGAERMLGHTAHDIVGRPLLDLAPPGREPDYRMAIDATSPQSEGAAFGIDTLARGIDSRLVPVRLSASVLREPAGAGASGETEAGWSVILRDLTEQKTLTEMSERLQEELYSRNRLEGIVGASRVMEEVRERILRVARFTSSVLLVGPSGTGKEVVANAIHYNSPRRHRPFVKVNCAAIPEDLLESELFGIERNVATGVDGRIGKFEMADGGTLFLDEIGDMSLATQARILRVLQEREFERVGGKRVIKVDVRIVAATNKDLEAEIQARRFRDDLYYRLNVILITLPPLSARREDIDPLIDHFLGKVTSENDMPRRKISLPARMLLNRYDWPGNVRELEHCIERAVVMSEGPEIQEADLPPSLLIWKELRAPGGGESARGRLAQVLRDVERRAVVEALERSGWVQARAARLLGISERSMWYRVKKLGLQPPR